MHHHLDILQIWSPREGIHFPILNAGSKQDFEVVVGEKRCPTSMPLIQRTTRGEVDEILVVGQHLNTMLGPKQIGSPFDKGQDNSCKLFVVDMIIDFQGCKLLEVEGDQNVGCHCRQVGTGPYQWQSRRCRFQTGRVAGGPTLGRREKLL